jgi:hypothetical protein
MRSDPASTRSDRLDLSAAIRAPSSEDEWRGLAARARQLMPALPHPDPAVDEALLAACECSFPLSAAGEILGPALEEARRTRPTWDWAALVQTVHRLRNWQARWCWPLARDEVTSLVGLEDAVARAPADNELVIPFLLLATGHAVSALRACDRMGALRSPEGQLLTAQAALGAGDASCIASLWRARNEWRHGPWANDIEQAETGRLGTPGRTGGTPWSPAFVELDLAVGDVLACEEHLRILATLARRLEIETDWATILACRCLLACGDIATYRKCSGRWPRIAGRCWQVDLLDARASIMEGKPADALERLREAVGLFPHWAEARYWLGIALARSGDMPEAVNQLRHVGVNCAPAALALAELHLRLGTPSSASSHLERAVRLGRANPAILGKAAMLARVLNETGTMLNLFSILDRAVLGSGIDRRVRAVRHDPDDPRAETWEVDSAVGLLDSVALHTDGEPSEPPPGAAPGLVLVALADLWHKADPARRARHKIPVERVREPRDSSACPTVISSARQHMANLCMSLAMQTSLGEGRGEIEVWGLDHELLLKAAENGSHLAQALLGEAGPRAVPS